MTDELKAELKKHATVMTDTFFQYLTNQGNIDRQSDGWQDFPAKMAEAATVDGDKVKLKMSIAMGPARFNGGGSLARGTFRVTGVIELVPLGAIEVVL